MFHIETGRNSNNENVTDIIKPVDDKKDEVESQVQKTDLKDEDDGGKKSTIVDRFKNIFKF